MSYASHKAAQQAAGASAASSSEEDAQKLQARNEVFMANAKRDGKESMLTMGEGGVMRMLDESDVGATLDKYSWTQTDSEVTIKVKVPAGTKSKAISLDVSSKKLKLKVLGDTILDGELHRNVAADDCTFTLEDHDDGRLVVVILEKLQKTSSNGHWKCVCIGEPEINTNFGPAIMTADPNDPNAIARMLQEGGLG